MLVLLALWGSVSATGLHRWWGHRATNRYDDQLRALLAGAVVPLSLPAPRGDVAAHTPARERPRRRARQETPG
jgi:hypothetical protein